MPILVLPRTLDAGVENLPDIGPKNSKLLAKVGVKSIRDLLLTLPYDWETYGGPAAIRSITPGAQATVVGAVASIHARVTKYKKMRLTEATIRDDSGAGLRIAWFNDKFVIKNLRRGDRVAVAGTVKSGYGGMPEMQNPYYERLDGDEDTGPRRIGGLMPKCHLVNGLSSRKLARWVESALPLADTLEDVLTADIRERHRLLEDPEAVRKGHKPDTA